MLLDCVTFVKSHSLLKDFEIVSNFLPCKRSEFPFNFPLDKTSRIKGLSRNHVYLRFYNGKRYYYYKSIFYFDLVGV